MFIVGAPRAGTTSLYEYLKNIPEISMCSIKEPNYFSKATIPTKFPHGKLAEDKYDYFKLFVYSKNTKYIGEASPSYLFDTDAPKLIYNVSPNSKIIISLRDPVERIFSLYQLHKNHLLTSLRDQILQEFEHYKFHNKPLPRLLNISKYTENVSRYLDIFGEKNVKIIIFEDFIKNEKKTMIEILKFLDLKNNFKNYKFKAYNTFYLTKGRHPRNNLVLDSILQNNFLIKIGRVFLPRSFRQKIEFKITTKVEKKSKINNVEKKPKINNEDKELLIDFYKDDVKKLENLLGQKMPWRNFML